ncbi:MAG TPA: IS4 family transposase, partial [Terracidiphilus sp.]|nr:IS4 family transposase [Terracidiphilus sp.]
LQVLSVTLFEKMPISQALQQPDYTSAIIPDPNQLTLFDF